MKKQQEITVTKAAEIIGIDPSQVRRYIRSKRLPARFVEAPNAVGGYYVIRLKDAQKFERILPGPKPKK